MLRKIGTYSAIFFRRVLGSGIHLFFWFSCHTFADIQYYPGLHDNPLIEDHLKTALLPHLLPCDHPMKGRLDFLFSQGRITESLESMQKAGFTILHAMPRSFAVIAKHPQIPGYIFKMHLDSEKKGRYGTDSTDWLTNRCIAAKKIKRLIEKKQIRYFIVPEKWIYILPSYPYSAKANPKPFILLATEIDICSDQETKEAWKTVVTKEHLNELYHILSAGYGSATLPTNIPYIGGGRFAFVDTEKPVKKKHFKKALDYLSPEMQTYWQHLTD